MLDVCRHKNTTQSRFCLQTCPQKRIDRPPFFDFLFLIPTQKHLWPKNLTIYHHPNTSIASSNPLSKCPCLFSLSHFMTSAGLTNCFPPVHRSIDLSYFVSIISKNQTLYYSLAWSRSLSSHTIYLRFSIL